MPPLDHDHGAVDQGQFRREQEEVGFAATAPEGGVVDEQIDLLVGRLAARLDLILAGLPHEKAVLLEIFADDFFVDGRHLDLGFRIPGYRIKDAGERILRRPDAFLMA